MPRLFALDHNFPQPIVDALAEFQVDAELVRVDAIDPRMADLDDWELLLAVVSGRGPASAERLAFRRLSRAEVEWVSRTVLAEAA